MHIEVKVTVRTNQYGEWDEQGEATMGFDIPPASFPYLNIKPLVNSLMSEAAGAYNAKLAELEINAKIEKEAVAVNLHYPDPRDVKVDGFIAAGLVDAEGSPYVDEVED